MTSRIRWRRLVVYVLAALALIASWWFQLYRSVEQHLFAVAAPASTVYGFLVMLVLFFNDPGKPAAGPAAELWSYGERIFSAFRHATMVYVSVVVVHLALAEPEVIGIAPGTGQWIVIVAIATPAYLSLLFFWGQARQAFDSGVVLTPVAEPPGEK